MTHDDARNLLTALLPHVERESAMLTPFPRLSLDAVRVFDAIRATCDPPMDVEQFNVLADEIEAARKR